MYLKVLYSPYVRIRVVVGGCFRHTHTASPYTGHKEAVPRARREKEKIKMKNEFFMTMVPPTVTHQEKQVRVKNGKPIFYEPTELKDARAKLMAYLGKHVPEKPYTGAIELQVMWCFPRGDHHDGEYRITKPDTDNLQKLLKDCMTECGYWKDDALICREIVEKFWAERPGIYIRVTEL